MDAKHIISIKIDGVWYQTPVIHTQQEFESLMDMLGWNVPYDMKIYHFHGNENERNPVMQRRPVMEIDIEQLFKTETSPYTYLDTRRNKPLKVKKQSERFAIAYSPNTDSFYFIDTEDARYRRVAQYTPMPIALRDAAAFVNEHHRHCTGTKWHKFSVALEADGDTIGVVIASTPKARGYDRQTLELNRVCTKPGYHNACSKLISIAINIGKTMGYRTFISYTLMGEDGTSLKAAGFEFAGYTEDSSGWGNLSRPRKMPERYPLGRKKRWIYRI